MRLAGATTVLDLGHGSGFRTIFYALNHPEVLFEAVDTHPGATDMLKRRIERLKIGNVTVVSGDLMHVSSKADVVLGIDCIQKTTSFPAFIQALSSYINREAENAAIAFPFYDQKMSRDINDSLTNLFSKNGLTRMEAYTCDYTPLGGRPKIAHLVIARQ